MHQTSGATSSDRYPELFKAIVAATPKDEPDILSFGCSTGEECWTMRDYFPNSMITGVDSNVDRVKIADTSNLDPDMEFWTHIPGIRQFDIALALSVFCRWPDLHGLESSVLVYPFDMFHRGVHELDKSVKVGGLLSIYNANYRFKDSIVSERYELIPTPEVPIGFVDVFNVDNKLAPDQNYNEVLWRKKW